LDSLAEAHTEGMFLRQNESFKKNIDITPQKKTTTHKREVCLLISSLIELS
jgi:hypothetical protein